MIHPSALLLSSKSEDRQLRIPGAIASEVGKIPIQFRDGPMVSGGKLNYSLAMDDWKLIATKLNDDGFGLNLLRTVRENGREVWCADVNREGKRWIVHAEDPASAFLELERQTRLDDFVFR